MTRSEERQTDAITFFCPAADPRMAAAAQVLRRAGYRQQSVPGTGGTDFVLLPAPVRATQELAAMAAALPEGCRVFGGGITPQASVMLCAAGAVPVDYLQDETLAWQNAALTAEGALGILLAARPEPLRHARVLVLGFGRIAQSLLPPLLALGCRVCIAARRSEARAQAESLGAQSIVPDAPEEELRRAEYLVNTVPAQLLGPAQLALLPRQAFWLELAAEPGGLDRHQAEQLGLVFCRGGGLPGKWSPAFAGRAVGSAVLRLLKKGEEKGGCSHG